jgi:branched-chain amino acid transport system permease protein
MDGALNFLITGAANGFIYSMIAIGFVLIFRCSRIFNFAQGEITILGAYVFYAATVQLKLPFLLAIFATIGLSVVLGMIIERVLLRPVIGQPILALVILTLALGGFIRGIMVLVWGTDWLSLPPLFPQGGISLGKIVTLSYPHIFFFGVSLALIVSLGTYYRYSRGGLAMRVAADDIIVARLLGIKVTRVLAVSWIIASLVGAAAGILLTSVTGVHYAAGEVGFKSMSIALVGGLESLGGVILMGPILGIIETLVAGYLDPLVGGGVSEVASYIVLLIVLIFRPHGIFGWETIERV